MVSVRKDKRDWKVILTFKKDDCPYVCYPADYHGCKHPFYKDRPDIPECTLENCPTKL